MRVAGPPTQAVHARSVTARRGRPRLLVVGETAVPTGYARVADSLLGPLQPAFDVHQLSTWAGATLPARSWPTYFNTSDKPFTEHFAGLLEGLLPDAVLILHDLRTVHVLAGVLEARRAGVRAANYSPLDVLRPKAALVRPLQVMDVVVAYTPSQARTLRGALDGAAVSPRVEVVSHGVDTDSFRPLSRGAVSRRRSAARARVFGPRCPPDAFVVLNANRNHLRKRMDLTVEAFALFARERPDTMLCLHSGARDPLGWDLHALVRRHSLEGRVLLTSPDSAVPDADDARLNLVYNACDVGLNTSVGEGWGLTSFEHAATGAAQVVPDHTACAELWRSHGVLIPATEPLATVDPGRDEQRVHADDVAGALAGLYEDRAALHAYSRAARRHATNKQYAWSAVAHQWRHLLEALVS